MTPSQIIKQADDRTERRSNKILDLKTEFALILQEFCLKYPWHWRRLSYGFTTVANQSTYDLSQSSQVDSGFVEGVTPQKYCRHGIKLISGGSWCPIEPIFEQDWQDDILGNPTYGTPTGYFVAPGTESGIYLTDIPAAAFSMRASFWAVTILTSDQLPEKVPLVPAYLHHLLTKRLEAQILAFTIGEKTARYIAMMQEFERACKDAAVGKDFADGRIVEYKDESDESIQSTGTSMLGGGRFLGRGVVPATGGDSVQLHDYTLSPIPDGVTTHFVLSDTPPSGTSPIITRNGLVMALNLSYTHNDHSRSIDWLPGYTPLAGDELRAKW